MSLVKWRDDFSVGIEAVDHEHQELLSLINAALLNISMPDSNLDSMEYLGEIYAKISSHFALEEKVMREAKYGEYADHKEDHDRLLEIIRDMMDDFEDQPGADSERFAEQLNHWFADHFVEKDARMHKMLDEN